MQSNELMPVRNGATDDFRCRVWAVLLIGLALLGLGVTSTRPVAAAELSGTVQISAMGKALRASETVDAVVYFRPRAAFAPPVAMPLASMATRRKQFEPRVLAITPGTPVRFPNLDPILHNAFSTSAGNAFDMGVYSTGEGSPHIFTKPGLVKVYCNVHHSMSGHILVVDTPWLARPDAQGHFTLTGLPDGVGDLVVFHDRSAPWQRTIDPAQTQAVEIVLELARRKVPEHMNKFGKPYLRGASARSY